MRGGPRSFKNQVSQNLRNKNLDATFEFMGKNHTYFWIQIFRLMDYDPNKSKFRNWPNQNFQNSI